MFHSLWHISSAPPITRQWFARHVRGDASPRTPQHPQAALDHCPGLWR
ncbi:hypothetical protein ACFFX0_18220 [Citricoccus parietis]|uniref:Uncharacterized protein n=1 Tax=Citricoccus parietis TaxID=592307 RepID=A0ABV5G3I9_9MICC